MRGMSDAGGLVDARQTGAEKRFRQEKRPDLPVRPFARLRSRGRLYPVAAAAFHVDGRPGGHPVVEIDDVLVEHAHAARGDLLADAPRLVGAVDAEQGVVPVLVEVEGARAEWVVEAGVAITRQLGLQAHHGRGRGPGRPYALAAHIGGAAPGEALAADTDAVAD